MSHGRVPRLPRDTTSAWQSVATEATAIASGWTAMPMSSVRDCGLADLRVRGDSCLVWCTRRLWLVASSPAMAPEVSFLSRKS
jgi:hypothetical protein